LAKNDRQSIENRLWGTSDNSNLPISDLAFLVETDGKPMVSTYGKSLAGTSTAIIVEKPLQLDPVLVPSTEGVLLDGSASLVATGVYEVTFVIANIDGTNSVTVDIGVDIAAGGSLAGAEYFMKDVIIPAGGSSGPKTLTLAADDDIRGIAGAANDAAIHFIKVVRVA
jgi:hypothetical protein